MEKFDRVSVKAIIREPKEPGRWLLLRNCDCSYLTLPGGGLEKNETLLEALKRELREEICLDVPFEASEVYRLYYSAATTDKKYLWVIFEVVVPKDFTPRKGSGVKHLQYLNPRHLTGTKAPVERRILECYRAIRCSRK